MGSQVEEVIVQQPSIAERPAFAERAVLTPEEAAHYCGMTPDLFWAHVRAGEVKFVNLSMSPARIRTGPRLVGFRRAALDEFLTRLEVAYPKDQAELVEAAPAPATKRGRKPAKAGEAIAPAEPPLKTWS